jgi:hypothetical protein
VVPWSVAVVSSMLCWSFSLQNLGTTRTGASIPAPPSLVSDRLRVDLRYRGKRFKS